MTVAMRYSCNIGLLLFLGRVWGQDYFEERHKYQVRTQVKNFSDIPKRFDIHGGDNAVALFKKYTNNIQNLAQKDNVTVIYKISVDVTSRENKKIKVGRKKPIVKKFKVPLKKNSMKLSNFEMALRKRVSDIALKQQELTDKHVTTEKQMMIHTTKPTSGGKYKPIIHGVKTNYTKVIRPVRNKIITLTR